ncbi:IS256 family transposase [Ktedonobacter sp. SOSP1-52]|uniref:IS256 family transposase n=1 Tax=Ktedonobacter sp. SOSP1-52 TaxID=2778366 RepID=UPI0019156270|nr:IS256 family transposase [Ktedonobacter sp. SOSP1-52]GHO63702.1 IS256 family transposase [Ktedonobacter sp. SOSP1-52]GHO64437.1 IS256 family transposase [Ktedonobacter sp. SOSP1-52]GHO69291.1 IS256 family transposase [Ktedonobacter sp. SOSP1-52]GHO70439.1 IS256 family transposase [Ktedonobacter sp. SOSP1-52]GHO71637.1 IS256 family transposase [Ktedonobacter sp. SOSP1-52]
MTIRKEILDELLKDYADPKDILAEGGLLKQLTKAVIERCLETELEQHLGYAKYAPKAEGSSNARNGKSRKLLQSEQGPVEISVPRDREGSFEPQLVRKHQSRLEGLEQKILTLYAHGQTTRDIQAQLQEMYGVEVSPTLIANVTDAVIDEVHQWQTRPLDALYPIVYVDCLVVKVRESQRVINKALYLVLGITMQGQKDLLGMWISQTEGAKFWLSVFTELHNRGLKDIFIACVDGLTGLPEAIETVFPRTQVQLCMVHLVRNSLRFVAYKHSREVAADLRAIYTASTQMEAEFNLELFAEKWDQQYPTISASWRAHWTNVIPLFAFPEDIRKIIYTTNAIESLNMTLRKMTRNRRIFPSDESVFKIMYLAVQTVSKKWTMPLRDWKAALNRFAIEFADRFPTN